MKNQLIRLSLALMSCPSAVAYAGNLTIAQQRAIQVVADVTLIDAECRNVNATFDIAFQYAENTNVRVVDLLPTGN